MQKRSLLVPAAALCLAAACFRPEPPGAVAAGGAIEAKSKGGGRRPDGAVPGQKEKPEPREKKKEEKPKQQPPAVERLGVPEGGICPETVLDEDGNVHLIYFKGSDPKKGDVFYVRSEDDGKTFSPPLKVNSEAGSVTASGNIRAADLALGKDNRVHVSWIGGDGKEFKFRYARLADDGKSFEPQQDLMQWTRAADGGGSLAADKKGNVWVVWHAAPSQEQMREENARSIYAARSKDEGKTFEKEGDLVKPTDAKGVCPCCDLRAISDGDDGFLVVYRTAFQKNNRDAVLLAVKDGKTAAASRKLGEWFSPT